MERSQRNRKGMRSALIACAILSAVGLGVSFELTRVYRLARSDPDYHSFCAVSEAVNCETVAMSPAATILGAPTSVWASAGYFFSMTLAAVGLIASEPVGLGLLGCIGFVFTAVSAILVYWMLAVIESLCILCAALDIVNAGLLIMALLAIRLAGLSIRDAVREDLLAMRRSPILATVILVAGAGALGAAYGFGSRIVRVIPAPEGHREAGIPAVLPHPVTPECTQDEAGTSASPQIRTGVSADGHPWIGAEHPVVEVQEFTDYQCPHCRRAHFLIRRLVSQYPDALRVVHRHFPLDRQCNRSIREKFHDRACELARVAVCAGRQGRFFEMNDFLFQHADEIRGSGLRAEDIASRLELDLDRFRCCMDDPSVHEQVVRDVEEGLGLGIEGTPAFVMDRTVHYGRLPPEVLERLNSRQAP